MPVTQHIFLIAALLGVLTFLALLSVVSDGMRGVTRRLGGRSGQYVIWISRELLALRAYTAANVAYASAGAGATLVRRISSPGQRASAQGAVVCFWRL